jgi:hypothetical protein
MAKGISFPIDGYLCLTMVPSKSTAIIISEKLFKLLCVFKILIT